MRKGDKPAGEYMQKVKALADAMATTGSPLRDDEIIDYMLTGLGSVFNPIAASMNFAGTVTLSAFYSSVLHYEALQQQQSELEDWTSSTNVASRPGYIATPGRGNDSGRPSGGRPAGDYTQHGQIGYGQGGHGQGGHGQGQSGRPGGNGGNGRNGGGGNGGGNGRNRRWRPKCQLCRN